MKFITYKHQETTQTGVLDAETNTITPLDGDQDMLTVIASGTSDIPLSNTTLSLSDVDLLAPIPRPRRNIFCIGRNDHAKEFADSGFDATASDSHIPDYPVVFTKAPSTVIATGDEIDPHLNLTEALDYEAELGVIIGTGGRGITKEQAMDHVWGYTNINDVTARDMQKKHAQWFLGKSLDTHCPMGPWAVTRDEVGDQPLDLLCTVNGETRQQANTADLIFDIPTIIETISAGITLEPGDIIATGTPVGVGIGFNPPKFLSPGDVVEVSFTHLGTLRNQVGRGQ